MTTAGTGPTPMFPLGIVHFPHVPLPLRVFEPRYRQLTIDCLEGDREFGVVLIERGSEVGGGDARFDVGTMTTIVDAGFDPEGLVRLLTVGTRRVRVRAWLDDDPYPRAVVDDLPAPTVGAAEIAAMDTARRGVTRAFAMRAELDLPSVPAEIPFDPDPAKALFQLAAIAPLGPADKQRLLAADTLEMLEMLAAMMEEENAVLASRLAGH